MRIEDWISKNTIKTLILILLFIVSALSEVYATENIPRMNKSYQDSVIQIILAVSAVAGALIAWWRWDVLKKKSDDDTYLKTLEILTSSNHSDSSSHSNSQSALVGACYSLKTLSDRNPHEFALPTVLAIEASIREQSEISYYEWLNSLLKGKTCIMGASDERKRIPAIIDMLRVALKIRKDHQIYDQRMELGFADLRGLLPADINICKEAFNNANLARADLRYVVVEEESPLLTSRLNGAWFDMKRYICDSNKNTREIIYDRTKDKLLSTQCNARYFLSGDWSHSKEIKKNEIKKNKDIFKSSRIGGGPGVNLDGMDLSECDFQYAVLIGATFRGTILEDTDFSYADLRNADFTGANFIGQVKFKGSNLVRAIFKGDQIPDSVKDNTTYTPNPDQ